MTTQHATADYVRARIDPKTRDSVVRVLDSYGLTISDFLRMSMALVARDQTLPFAFKTPNQETLAAMEEGDAILRSGKAQYATAKELFHALNANAKTKKPVKSVKR